MSKSNVTLLVASFLINQHGEELYISTNRELAHIKAYKKYSGNGITTTTIDPVFTITIEESIAAPDEYILLFREALYTAKFKLFRFKDNNNNLEFMRFLE